VYNYRFMKDILAGTLFVIIGSVFLFISTSYKIGTTAAMGPGYFPILIATLLIIFGVVIFIKGFYGHSK